MNDFNQLLSRRDIVIIEPHPDDCFLGLWDLFKEGGFERAHLITLTDGEKDYYTGRDSLEVAAQRSAETQSFVNYYDIRSHHQFHLGDGKIKINDAEEAIRSVVEKLSDPVMFCTSLEDKHKDHIVACAACIRIGRTVEYCIDTPKSTTFAIHDVEDWTEKLRKFGEFYPSQVKDLTKNHKGFNDRLETEWLSFSFANLTKVKELIDERS